MRSLRASVLVVGITAALAAGTGCGSGKQSNSHGGSGGAGDGAAGATGGTGASGGSGGTGASGGSGGTGASGGSGGTGASGGSGGTGASGGSGGTDASAGAGGTGTGGSGGVDASAGSGGTGTGGGGGVDSGTGGTGGSGGTGGNGGTGGSGGNGGTGGTGGSGGTGVGGTGGTGAGGTGGTGGTGAGGTGGTGTGGGAGLDAGSDAMADAGADADAGAQCQSNADCDNGVYCDGAETCDPTASGADQFGCVAGTPVVCQDDGFTCTKEFCDESTNSCQTVSQDSVCQDTSFCDGVETCNPSASGANQTTGCVAGTPVNCDDGLSCTTDTCDDTSRVCVHTPVNAQCDDGQYCNGIETCDPINGAAGTGCKAGTPVNCNDNVGCTTDTCNETTDSCDHTPVDAACDNGVYCDGAEVCNPSTGCQAGPPITCTDDGYACTVEACDEASKQCQTTLDNSKCPSGEFCTNQGCQAGTQCSNDNQCDDGNACNGVEHCDLTTTPGVCKSGTPVNCNDFIACTYDQCNPSDGSCTHTPVDAFCSNGNVCDGIETCDTNLGCTSGTPLDCTDNVACTIDSCDAVQGCIHAPNAAACSDGLVCNGTETCDPTSGCQAGTPPTCPDDGIACTSDVCSESAGGCTHVPDDSLCGCGQSCSPSQGGCGNWCTVSTCQGKVYQCGDCVDNEGDCRIDSADPDCIGVCDNNESGFYGDIPGQNNAPCKEDCYFDQDTGSGNDDCYWSHTCDPLEVDPYYDPYGAKCAYDPNKGIPGTSASCSELQTTQSALCHSYCGPLTPNGCDCFGCCAIPDSGGTVHTVFLGSLDSSGNGSCTLADVADPTKCRPCTQVSSCLNTCDHCELCIGKTTLPPDCTQQTCPSGVQLCGQSGQLACPDGYYCVTGCCQPVPT